MKAKPVRTAFRCLLHSGVVGTILAITATASADAPIRTEYDVYMGGLHLAVAEVEIDVNADTFSLSMVTRLRGLSGLFSDWRAEASATGQVNGVAVAPNEHRFRQVRRGESETVLMRYDEGRLTNTVFIPDRESPGPDHPEFIPPEDLASAVDPVSGLVSVLRAVDRAETCGADVPVYDGRRRFDMVFTSIGEEVLPENRYTSYSGTALRCRVHLELVSGAFKSEGSDQFWSHGADRRDRELDVWFARPVPGGPVLPVRMQAESRFGAVMIHLNGAQVAAP